MSSKSTTKRKVAITIAALVASVMFLGSIYASKNAYAHSFSSDESAIYLAKVQEIPAEASLVASDAGNSTLVKWHVDRLTSFWTSYDTGQMAERNALLAKEIPDTIANITMQASMPNPNSSTISQLVSNLNGYMSESVQVRIDPSKLQNLTVSALAIKTVLDEMLNDYGNATGATMSMTDMNNMGKMSTNGTTATITNPAAYQSAQAMDDVVQNMWSDLKAKTPSGTPGVSNLDTAFANLKQSIGSKQPAGKVMEIVHGTIHPNLMTAYNLQMAGMAMTGNMSGMNSGNNGSMSGMNMGGGTSASGGPQNKRIEYVKESAMQRHMEHLHLAKSTGPYSQGTNFVFKGSGVMPQAQGNSQIQTTLDLSVYFSNSQITGMDIMGGNITIGNNSGDMINVKSGVAYYLPHLHKFIVSGYIPVKGSDGSISSVQLLRLKGLLNVTSGKLPSSASDSPLLVDATKTRSYLGSTSSVIDLTGTVTYAGTSSTTMNMGGSGSSMNMGSGSSSSMNSSMQQCGPVTVPIAGGSQNASYYVSATYNGSCAIDTTSYSMQHTCTVVNGIGESGHCEPITKGYTVNGNTTAAVLAKEEWFHIGNDGTGLAGITLKPGEFLDIADTTPFFSTMGHIASVIPCDQNGDPQVLIYQGILDGGLNTLEPIQPQYLQHMSDPKSGLCVYHFNFGATDKNPDGVTDFALLNVSKNPITLTSRNTLTFSLAEGYLNNAGGS